MAAIDANGITIEYEIEGDGEPLLLIAGLGMQLTGWPDEFVTMLAGQGFQVIRFDNRDIGLSTEFDWRAPSQARAIAGTIARRPPRAGYLIGDMADDAAGLLGALGITSAHAVGVSMGGMIAQALTIAHPDKVRSLCSIMSNTGDATHGRIAPRLLPKLARLPKATRDNAVERSMATFELISGPHYDADAVRATAEIGLARSFRPRGIERQSTAILASPDRTEALGEVIASTLVVHGLRDPLVKPSGGIATAKAVPGSRLIMYPDMGHDLPRPRWNELVEEIRRNADRAAVQSSKR